MQRAGKGIQGDILKGRISHFPGFFGVFKIRAFQLETQPTAFRNLCRASSVKNEIGISFVRGHITNMIQKGLVARRLKKLFRNVDKGLGKEKGTPCPIAFLKNLTSLSGIMLDILKSHHSKECICCTIGTSCCFMQDLDFD